MQLTLDPRWVSWMTPPTCWPRVEMMASWWCGTGEANIYFILSYTQDRDPPNFRILESPLILCVPTPEIRGIPNLWDMPYCFCLKKYLRSSLMFTDDLSGMTPLCQWGCWRGTVMASPLLTPKWMEGSFERKWFLQKYIFECFLSTLFTISCENEITSLNPR